MTKTNEIRDLTVPVTALLISAYKDPEAVENILAAIEKDARSYVSDVTTAAGRKNITSLAMKVVRSKTHFDGLGKDLNAERRAKIGIVDASRRVIVQRLDALRDELRKPLTEYNDAQTARLQKIKDLIEALGPTSTTLDTSEIIQADIDRITGIEITEETYAEYVDQAKAEKAQSLAALSDMQDQAKRREADQAELAELRKMAEARAAQDTKDLATKEATEREAREKQLAAENERLRIEREERRKVEAEERRKVEAEERRAKNTRRRNKAKSDIANSIAKIKKEDIPQALLDGLVAHCSVRF